MASITVIVSAKIPGYPPITGANVILTLTSTGKQYTGLTKSSGSVLIIAPNGRYNLSVSSVGYVSKSATGVYFAGEEEYTTSLTPVAAIPTVYACPTCGLKFATEPLLVNHMASAHPTPPPPPAAVFTCPTCGATFSTQADLDAHIAAVHPATSWPWPLNAIQDWFDNLWNNVISAPLNALNSFWTTYIVPKLDWIKDKLTESVNWIYDQLEPTISGINTSIIRMRTLLDDTLSPTIDGIKTSLGNMHNDLTRITNGAIADIINSLEGSKTWIVNQVESTLNKLDLHINSGIGSILTLATERFNTGDLRITSGIASILSRADESDSSLGTAMDTGFNNVDTWITKGIGGLWDSLTGLAGDLLSGVTGALGAGLSGFFDGVLKSLGWIADMVFGAVNFVVAKLKDGVNWLVSGLIDILTGAMSSGSPPKEIALASNVLMETMWDKQMKIIDSAYHSAPTGAEIQQTAITLEGVLIAAATAMMAAGVAADLAHPLKMLGIRATTREIVYWSGIPSVTAAIAIAPAAVGILRPLTYWLNEKWPNMMPPVDDIIRFSLREVWIPERRELLLKFYPPEPYQGLMTKQGYAQEFAEDYWAAHWVLPSVGQLNELLYRKIITDKIWETEVRYNDLVPYAVPWLKQIIYQPYTRVDIRRMWDIGLVTDKEMLINYQWLGYDDEHAQRMMLWTKAYIIAGDVRALYSKGWINEAGAREMLVNVGVPKERVDVFMMRVVKSGQAERMTAEKDLTKTDILRLFKLNLMSRNETIGMLMDLGYDEDEANYLIQIQEYAPQLELKELTMSQILKAYSNEIYLRDEAKSALMEAGWSEAAAEMLLKLEDVKLKDAQTVKMMEKELSRTDIIKGIAKEIIDKDTGAQYLSYLGYSQWEINFIFALEEIA